MKQKTPFPIKKRTNKKVMMLSIAAVALLLIAGGLWYVKFGRDSNESGIRAENTVDYSPASPQDNQQAEEEKGTTNGNSDPKDPEEPPTTPVEFSVTVTGANPDPTNKVARVSTLVNGVTSGTCVVTFTKQGQPNVTATNQVALQTNSYACPNFTVPYSQFPASGEWNVSVAVTNSNKTVTGTWQGGAITIQK